MSITRNGEEYAVDCVMEIKRHCWLDGMDEDTATWYDVNTNELKSETVYYGGIDGHNLDDCLAAVDLSKEVCNMYIHNNRQKAYDAFVLSVLKYKQEIRKDSNVEVIRGRKIKIGTKLHVFWIGERPTYFAKMHPWCKETMMLVGCTDESNNKVWIDADYLKVIDVIKSPNAKERKAFCKKYFDNVKKKVVK